MNFQEQFSAAFRVSTPLVAVRTFDADSAVYLISQAVASLPVDEPLEPAYLKWDSMRGLSALNKKGEKALKDVLGDLGPESTSSFELALECLARAKGDVITFALNSHMHWGSEPKHIQGIWNLRKLYKSAGNMLVMLSAPGSILPAELTNDVLMLEEPLPTPADIQRIVQKTFSDARIEHVLTDDLLDAATSALTGLPEFPCEQATAMCLSKKEKTLNLLELWERKRQIINQTPGLSVWQGQERLEDIGGIENVKNFIRRVLEGNDAPQTIIFMDEIEKAFAGTGTDMSGTKTELTGSMLSWMQDREVDGVIFIGIPGVSKSQLAKAAGGSYGIPVINFDLAGMQSSLVGSSGANLRSAQKTVDAISNGRVLAIATCNSINALPPELRRRFNLGIFFFDTPSPEEQAIIWKLYRDKYGISPFQVTPEHGKWTGAEIKECCKKAYRLRLTLEEAAEYIVPVAVSAGELVHNLRQASSGKYISASVPGIYHYRETEALVEETDKVTSIGRKMRDF